MNSNSWYKKKSHNDKEIDRDLFPFTSVFSYFNFLSLIFNLSSFTHFFICVFIILHAIYIMCVVFLSRRYTFTVVYFIKYCSLWRPLTCPISFSRGLADSTDINIKIIVNPETAFLLNLKSFTLILPI